MLDRRHSHFKRACASGVWLAGLGMIPLALIEAIYVLFLRRPEFGSVFEGVRMVWLMFAIPLGIGILLGLVEGPVLLLLGWLSEKLAKRRVFQPKWMARLCTVALLPAVAAFVSEMFSGRRARQLPGRVWVIVAVGAIAISGCYVVIRLIVAGRQRFRLQRWGRREALICVAGLITLAVVFYQLDSNAAASAVSRASYRTGRRCCGLLSVSGGLRVRGLASV